MSSWEKGVVSRAIVNPGEKVTLNLAVQADRAYFGVNGDFVEAFDVSSIPGPGTVGVASAFFGDTTIPETGTEFEDLVIWSLDSGTQVAVPTESATTIATETATEAVPEPTATTTGTTRVQRRRPETPTSARPLAIA